MFFQSVYGVSEDSQSQSPVHMASHVIRKTTKDDLRKQVGGASKLQLSLNNVTEVRQLPKV